jgi:hypothetical protein
MVAWKNLAVHNHIYIAHIVQYIINREIVRLGYACDNCPDAVVGVFAGFI